MPTEKTTSDFYELMKSQISSTNTLLKSVGVPPMTTDEVQDNCDFCGNYSHVVAVQNASGNTLYACNACYCK